MKLLSKFVRAAGTLAAACAISLPAQAAVLQYAGGQFSTFDGFDWASDGTAFTTGFAPVANDAFTLTYFASAIALRSPNTVPSGMDVVADGVGTGFGWTIVANLNERVTACFAGGTICSFQIDAGSTFDVYYNPSLAADTTAGSLGTGYELGTKIISGNVNVTAPFGGGTFTVSGPGGTGSSSLLGTITYTNSAFVAPDLIGTTFGTQLNLGNLVTQWTNPGGFDGVAFNAGNIVFQADGNQTFSEIPEPHTLGLVAVALIGAGAATRRKKAA